MEKKTNLKLFIIVGVLLIFGGTSLAYFASKALTSGSGASTNVTTASIKGATVTVDGLIAFDSEGMLPGHKSISAVKVTATGNNELIPYNLYWSGNSGISQLNFTVYKTSKEESITSTCEKRKEIVGGTQQLSEECTISNIDKLGSIVSSGSIKKDDTKVIITKDEFITAINNGISYYYYIIIEYPNLDISQNDDMGQTITGKIYAEESNAKADINIIAAYIKQEDGTYQESDDIPQSGYALNTTKSTCSNGATPTWKAPNITVNNLSKSGTSCYLYFDKGMPVSELLASVKAKSNGTKASFSSVATTNEGIFEASDGMYGGTSYYWRGAVTDNHVIFANYCWRIIRINGDGTIRMIYNGAVQSGNTCLGNGKNTTNVEIGKSTYHSGAYDQSYYVGWTYTTGQRPSSSINNGSTGTTNTIKSTVETWYNTNIGYTNSPYASKVADGKYCNDRNTGQPYSGWSGYVTTWSANGTKFAYAGVDRLLNKYQPTLSCSNNGDIYQVKAALITADEVEFAGGKGEINTSYYLYSNSWYWIMSPYFWNGSSGAYVFIVNSSGDLNGIGAHGSSGGVRPVINLSTDVTFEPNATGEATSPYVVQN